MPRCNNLAYKLPSLESSSCARLLHQSFANDSAKTYLHRIYVHVAAESAQKLIPGVSFGNLWQHTASMFKLSYGPTSLSAVSTLSTIGVDGGCVHIRHELHDFVWFPLKLKPIKQLLDRVGIFLLFLYIYFFYICSLFIFWDFVFEQCPCDSPSLLLKTSLRALIEEAYEEEIFIVEKLFSLFFIPY